MTATFKAWNIQDKTENGQCLIAPLYNHMEKVDFLYFEFEDSKGDHLIVFRDSSVTFLQKSEKYLGAFLKNKSVNASK